MNITDLIKELRELDDSVDTSIIKGISTYRGACDPAIGLYAYDDGCQLYKDFSDDSDDDYKYRLVHDLKNLPSKPSELANLLEHSIGFSLEGYKGGYETIYDISDVYPSSTWGDVYSSRLESITVVDNVLVLNSY